MRVRVGLAGLATLLFAVIVQAAIRPEQLRLTFRDTHYVEARATPR
ncbi:hypothetical protein IAG41_02835 [Sphingomonas sp. JC676]|nr:hypothetical protein [Sphingomonas sp. JC676]MBC9031317.1 hypothetical protein [Sphingomonas sp. JC676]